MCDILDQEMERFEEFCGGWWQTHTEQLETGRINIHSRFVRTFELAIYTILLLTDGRLSHGERKGEKGRERECNLLWDRGEAVCVILTRK
jgi:hypothetical protein